MGKKKKKQFLKKHEKAVTFSLGAPFASEFDDEQTGGGGGGGGGNLDSRQTNFATAAAAAAADDDDDYRRRDYELGEYGFPNDGYDYSQHLRVIGESSNGARGVFVAGGASRVRQTTTTTTAAAAATTTTTTTTTTTAASTLSTISAPSSYSFIPEGVKIYIDQSSLKEPRAAHSAAVAAVAAAATLSSARALPKESLSNAALRATIESIPLIAVDEDDEIDEDVMAALMATSDDELEVLEDDFVRLANDGDVVGYQGSLTANLLEEHNKKKSSNYRFEEEDGEEEEVEEEDTDDDSTNAAHDHGGDAFTYTRSLASRTARSEVQQVMDERFDRLLRTYDDDDDDDSGSSSGGGGGRRKRDANGLDDDDDDDDDVDDDDDDDDDDEGDDAIDEAKFDSVLDEFLHEKNESQFEAQRAADVEAARLKALTLEMAAAQSDDDDEDEEEEGSNGAGERWLSSLAAQHQKEVDDFDVQSYQSTFTNTDNHPGIIDEEDGGSRRRKGGGASASSSLVPPPTAIVVGRSGLALAGIPRRNQNDNDNDDMDKNAADSTANNINNNDSNRIAVNSRKKGESAEEKAQRKAAVKAARRERRVAKKATRLRFHREALSQQHSRTKGAVNAAVVKI